MSIFKTLFALLKVVLPFLRTAAEKAFKKLPKEKQDELKLISRIVQIVKIGWEDPKINVDNTIKAIMLETGLTEADLFKYIAQYWKEKGITIGALKEGIAKIWQDAATRSETGLKSLWSGLSNIVSSTVAEIDWELLLMGVGEFVYRSFVRGKIKI